MFGLHVSDADARVVRDRMQREGRDVEEQHAETGLNEGVID